ncbi:hypothetical protein PPMP20_21715 [Paraburkholderia phymatum]|uniref:Cyclase dehydrase n=1 Tax=Paraburkholderia phymatum (strain DSM 17167 / CIP 108236 / LMG 21445 / STM815) TaxID=391038 RepID=B2JMV8_PARP8|nr:hypothetical protein [Paraburkholderia phymatum]ACC74351.1 conserved hypothetical protein [Paraburkholderia phymatum STM815]
MNTRSQESSQLQNVVRAIGWFSIALGVAEVLAPRATARTSGIEQRTGLVRSYGMRELVCGVGVLCARKPGGFLLARLCGDLLDLATVAVTRKPGGRTQRSRAMGAALGIAAIAAADAYATRACSRTGFQRRNALPAVTRDYTARTGFPRTPSEMRGAALSDFETPRDIAGPRELLPFSRQTDDAQTCRV